MLDTLRMRLLRLTVLLLLCACQRRESRYFGTIEPQHPETMMVVNNGSEPEWIDPGKCSDSSGGELILNLFSGLVESHTETLEPQGDIAESWSVDPTGKVYTFHLRDSVWSDGTPLHAEDFVWSWVRVLTAETQAKYAATAYVLKNAKALHQQALQLQGFKEGADKTAIANLFAELAPIEEIVIDDAAASRGFREPSAFIFFKDGALSKADLSARAQALVQAQPIPWASPAGLTVSLTTAKAVGVYAADPRTLVVELENPVPYFLSLLAHYTFKPVPKHVLEALAARGMNVDLWTRPPHIVSNGPYVLSEWKFRQYFLLTKNPRYWDAAHVRLEQVKLLQIESYVTALNMYRSGELDWLGHNTAIPNEFIEPLSHYADFRRSPYLATYHYWINTKRKPLDNPLVRRALSLAIDRNAIVTHVTRGKQIPSADLVPDGLAGYKGLRQSIFDPEEARRLLTQAGYPKGENFPRIGLMYNTSEGHKQIAEAVQQMWKQHLGLTIELENREWNVFLNDMNLGNFDMARMGWVADYPDPNAFLFEILSAHAGNNHSGWQDPAFEALLEQANREQNAAARLALLREAEQRALLAQPLIPIYTYTRSTVVKPYVKGFWDNHQDRHAFKTMWIDRRFYEKQYRDQQAQAAF